MRQFAARHYDSDDDNDNYSRRPARGGNSYGNRGYRGGGGDYYQDRYQS